MYLMDLLVAQGDVGQRNRVLTVGSKQGITVTEEERRMKGRKALSKNDDEEKRNIKGNINQ